MSFIKMQLNQMLTAREQLMEDIDSICDDFFYSNYNGDISEAEELVRMLCDAVCKNFPSQSIEKKPVD